MRISILVMAGTNSARLVELRMHSVVCDSRTYIGLSECNSILELRFSCWHNALFNTSNLSIILWEEFSASYTNVQHQVCLNNKYDPNVERMCAHDNIVCSNLPSNATWNRTLRGCRRHPPQCFASSRPAANSWGAAWLGFCLADAQIHCPVPPAGHQHDHGVHGYARI